MTLPLDPDVQNAVTLCLLAAGWSSEAATAALASLNSGATPPVGGSPAGLAFLALATTDHQIPTAAGLQVVDLNTVDPD